VTSWGWVPLVMALVVPLVGPRIVRLLPPAAAVRLATILAIAIAASTGLVLAIAAELTVAQIEAITDAENPHPSAVSLLFGAGAAVLVTVLTAAAVSTVTRSSRQLMRVSREARDLGEARSGLVVVQGPTPAAFAVLGRPGRVVVSTAMLRALTAGERNALLAHENAHLRYHHQMYIQAAAVAAAANPLLRPLVATVRRNTERWADEAAAAEVGDRRLAASAVARAALASRGLRHQISPSVNGVLGGWSDESEIAHRVRCLLHPPVRQSTGLTALVLATAVFCMAAGGAAAVHGHAKVERIEAAAMTVDDGIGR
jgi:Zn-dependent protease with chaperone function